MARGLMQNAAPAAAAPPQGALPEDGVAPAPPADPAPIGQGRRATDEEKALYREFLATVIDVVYQEKTAEAVGNIIHSTTQTPQGAAATAVEPLALIISGAVARVAYSELENGKPITREMAAAAAASLAADLGRNMAESVGVPPIPDDQIQAIYLRSMELLADQRDETEGRGVMAGRSQAPQQQPAAAGSNGLMMSRPPNRKARRAQAAQQRRQGRGQSRA